MRSWRDLPVRTYSRDRWVVNRSVCVCVCGWTLPVLHSISCILYTFWQPPQQGSWPLGLSSALIYSLFIHSVSLRGHFSLFLSCSTSVIHQAMSTTPRSRRVKGHGSGPPRTFQSCHVKAMQEWPVHFFWVNCWQHRLTVVWNLTTIKMPLTSRLISHEFHINTTSPSLAHIYSFIQLFIHLLTHFGPNASACPSMCAWINMCPFMHE